MITKDDLLLLSIDWFEAAGVIQDEWYSLRMSWWYLILYTFEEQ